MKPRCQNRIELLQGTLDLKPLVSERSRREQFTDAIGGILNPPALESET